MPDKAVIYARYSSDNQRDASIDQQVKACTKFADSMTLEVIRVYEDRALTGRTDKRPSFLQMIKDSAKHKFQYVIVYSLDRFSRNKYDSVMHKHTLKENGVTVLSAMEHITDDPTGALMESILEGFAEYYSRELSQKINRGLTDNAEKGIVNGSVPLGYKRGPDGHAVIVEEEAEIVREIFRRVNNDEPFIRIIEDLNRRGLKTKKGKDWNRSSFNTILGNDRYIGIYRYKQFVHENGFPAIVDKETFYNVQKKVAEKPNARGNAMRRKTEYGTYLLTGKLICGKCGALMVGISGVGRHGDRCFYYTCNRKRLENGCDKKNVRRGPVELAVTTYLQQMLMDDDLIEWMAEQTVAYQNTGRDDSEYESKQQRQKEVARKRTNILNAIADGIYTASTKDMLEALEAEEGNLQMEIAAMKADRESMITKDMLLSYLESLRDGDVTDPNFQRLMIDSFLEKAVVYDDKIELFFKLTKEHKEVTIPFGNEGEGGNEESPVEGLYKLSTSPLCGLIQTPVYFIQGVFKATFPFAG